MDYSDWAPRDARALISAGKLQGQTLACAPDMPRPTFAFCRRHRPLTFCFFVCAILDLAPF